MKVMSNLVRDIRRVRLGLSELMAHEDQVAMVREIGRHYGLEFGETGDMIVRTRWGGAVGYIPEVTCDELNALSAFAGAVRVKLRREVEGQPAGTNDEDFR